MEKRLVELESRFAFAEQTIATLNDVVTQQHQRIDTLEADLRRLQLIVNKLKTPDGEGGDDER